MRLDAPSWAALLEQAAIALADLMIADAPLDDLADEVVRVELEASDAEALLVDWLDELIYRADVEGRVYRDVVVQHAEPTRMVARIRGGKPQCWKTSVKAATFHDLEVVETERGLQAAVVLDV